MAQDAMDLDVPSIDAEPILTLEVIPERRVKFYSNDGKEVYEESDFLLHLSPPVEI